MNKIIKLNSFLISVVLLFTCVCTPINCLAETFTEGYIFETNVNIRKSPTTTSKSVAVVSRVSVTVLNKEKDTKGAVNPETRKPYIWYNVSFTYSGESVKGYVREDLIDIYTYTIADIFKEQLSLFPKSYRSYLEAINKEYPNWVFIPEVVPLSFTESVSLQDNLFYKLVQSKYNSWRSLRKGCYNWADGNFIETDSGGWYGASREVIAHFMDPRNFLNSDDIFVFMRQSYNSKSQTLSSVEKIVDGSFLDAKITDKNDEYYNKRYAEVILIAAEKSSVNPLVLASTILQEQGTKGSTLSNGTTYNNTKVYNFFNFGASGSNAAAVLLSGKKYAFEKGWTTPSKAIIGGAVKYASEYINRGQDTYFYKNFNVMHPNEIWHQYAQNVADSVNSAKFLKKIYSNMKDSKLYFRIPIFNDLPSDVSELPKMSDKLNNYYFSDIKAEGLTPSFNRYTFEYSLSTNGDAVVSYKLPSGATLSSKKSFSLKKGQNVIKLVVKSQSGYLNTYTLNVDAEKAATLSLSANGTKQETSSTNNQSATKVMHGDCTGDGKITILDLADVRLHLLDIIILKGDNLKAADTNGDNKVTIIDLANIRLHLLGILMIK
ncbi:MAG: hypothetical protein IJD71_02090 [Clostridia bacterium]|nr:hypothetical protein [Clostridia bacterium]